jgi:hypothetical protein
MAYKVIIYQEKESIIVDDEDVAYQIADNEERIRGNITRVIEVSDDERIIE